MASKLWIVAGVLVLAAVALWHPPPHPAVQTAAFGFGTGAGDRRGDERRGSGTHRSAESARGRAAARGGIVYVAGAVRRPGLYPASAGERAAAAVDRAGGFAPGADAAGVNLAEPVADGDEVYVPLAGESGSRSSQHRRTHRRGSHRHGALPAAPDPAGVDVNAAGEDELSAVPGIGAALAARIVALRAVDGSFASLDQLLDVAGMTQTRLERARPYLRDP